MTTTRTTTTTIVFPPSPALSLCGIDLDAFLDSQHQLSAFPTPPFKTAAALPISQQQEDTNSIRAPTERPFAISVPDAALTSKPDDPTAIALAKAAATTTDVPSSQETIQSIAAMLVRAQLPWEVVAMAFNIIDGLRDVGGSTSHPSLAQCPVQLVVVAALSISVSYTHDHAPQPSWWSLHVSHSALAAQHIDRTVLRLLVRLDWRLHGFGTADAVHRATRALWGVSEGRTQEAATPA